MKFPNKQKKSIPPVELFDTGISIYFYGNAHSVSIAWNYEKKIILYK